MKKIIVIGFGLFGVMSAQAASPAATDFPFQQEIKLPSLVSQEEVRVELNQDVLQAVNERFGNFAVFDKSNTPYDYEVYFQDFHRINDISVLDVSSGRDGMNKAHIADDDVLTTYAFDEQKDGRDASWAVLDLGETVPLTRIEIFTPESARIRYVSIDAGATAENMKPVIAKRAFQQRLELGTELVRYIKLSFWGVQVKVDDVRVTAGPTGSVYINANPGDNLRLLYGGKEIDRIMYTARLSAAKKSNKPARTGKQEFNPLFPIDADNDGVDITEDNCPIISNRSQKDFDGDRIGNECDNAPEVLNSNQSDVDRDGIGDVIDNCKLVPNSDQADRDNDGWGNACDNAHAMEKTEVSSLIKVVGGIAVLVLLAFGIYQGRKTRKIKR